MVRWCDATEQTYRNHEFIYFSEKCQDLSVDSEKIIGRLNEMFGMSAVLGAREERKKLLLIFAAFGNIIRSDVFQWGEISDTTKIR